MPSPPPLSIELRLDARASTTALTPHDGLVVELEVHNLCGETLLVPGTQDQTAAWTFELREPAPDGQGELVRELSGLTHQAMMTRARIDHRPDLAALEPGSSWRWQVDLGTLHYGLPVGAHTLRVVLRAEATAARGHPQLRSNVVELEVVPAELERVELTIDNPVVERAVLVLVDDRGVVLRHHDLGQPLAAWSSARLDLPAGVGADLHTAQARFFDPSSFEPAFEIWAVWSAGGRVFARRSCDGRVTDEREAALPPGLELLRWACTRLDGTLELFFAGTGEAASTVFAFELDARGQLRPRFEHALAPGDAARAVLELRGSAEGYLILTGAEPGAPLRVDELDAAGGLIERRPLHPGGGRLRSLVLQPHRTFVGAWVPGEGEGHLVDLVYGELDGITRKRVRFDLSTLGAPVEELAAMSRSDGVWDVIVSTTDQRLHYGRLLGSSYERALVVERRELRTIAGGQPRYFPRVLASGGGFLGWFEREHGFRFRPLRHGKLQPLEDIIHG